MFCKKLKNSTNVQISCACNSCPSITLYRYTSKRFSIFRAKNTKVITTKFNTLKYKRKTTKNQRKKEKKICRRVLNKSFHECDRCRLRFDCNYFSRHTRFGSAGLESYKSEEEDASVRLLYLITSRIVSSWAFILLKWFNITFQRKYKHHSKGHDEFWTWIW